MIKLDVDTGLFEEEDYESEFAEGVEIVGFIPTVDSTNSDFESDSSRFVDYVDRGPRDVVLSGPVLGGWGPGRYHRSRRSAYDHLVAKRGADRVTMTRQSKGRWSFLIKNLKAS